MKKILDENHPGVILRQQIVDRKALSVGETASLLGISFTNLSLILNGKSGLSPEMCHRIAIVFNENAEDWAAIQSKHELNATADKVKTLNLKPYNPV